MALLSLKGRDIFWLVGTSSEHHNRVKSKFYYHMILSSGIAFTYLTSEFCFISRLLGRLGRTLGQWMDYLKPLKHCLFSLDGKGEPQSGVLIPCFRVVCYEIINQGVSPMKFRSDRKLEILSKLQGLTHP